LNQQLQNQGFLPRTLITFPKKRKAMPIPRWKDNDDWLRYQTRLKALIDVPVIIDDYTGEITFRKLPLTDSAYNLWFQEANAYYCDLANDGEQELHGQYMRGAENILRIAGIMAAMEECSSVETSQIANAIRVMAFHMSEWENLYARLRCFRDDILEPFQVWEWMCKRRAQHQITRFHPRDLYKSGPQVCRGDTKRTRAILTELVRRNYLKSVGREFEMRPIGA
jgi:hypothetical protein